MNEIRFAKLRPWGLVLLLLSVVSGAQAWTERMEHTWSMSEHESRATARELALEALRLRAAQAVGKVVEATTTLKDGKLKEEVRTVGVSMVKITQVKDQVKLDAQGRSVLVVSATVDVDETELQRRTEQMRKDRDMARQIGQLQAENDKLRKGLNDLSQSLRAATKPANVLSLLKQQQELMDALRRNETHIGNTFKPGALLAMADADSLRWAKDRAELERVVFGSLFAMPIQAKLVGVEKVDADSYRARVQVGWRLPTQAIESYLSKHFGYYKNWDGDFILSHSSEEKTASSGRIFEYFSSRIFYIRISLGGASEFLPVVYPRDDHMPSCEVRGQSYDNRSFNLGAVMFCSQTNKVGVSVNVDGSQGSNPVSIFLTAKQAAEARDLRVFLETRKASGVEYSREVVPK
jgi:hypothetical protein